MKTYLLILLILISSCTHHRPKKPTTHYVKSKAALARIIASRPTVSNEDLEQESILDDVNDLFSRKLGLFNNAEKPVVLNLIREAKKTIDIEIYEMKDEDFRDLLLEKLNRGVKVRIIKEPSPVGDSCDEKAADYVLPANPKKHLGCLEEKKYTQEFIARGGKYVYFSKKLCGTSGKKCFEHGKLIIIDKKTALISTGNFNSSNLCNLAQFPSACNRDYSYVSKDPQQLDLLTKVYDRDFLGVAYDLKSLMNKSKAKNITISPYSRKPIVDFINRARKKILIQNQYLEEPAWNDALIKAAKRGVEIQIMVTDFCNFGLPRKNKKTKIISVYSLFDSVGIKTKTFTSNIKIQNRPGYMHAKAIVVDDKMAWIGSVNGSVLSNNFNREYGIFFDRQRSVRKLIDVMEEDLNHPKAISWKKSLVCHK